MRIDCYRGHGSAAYRRIDHCLSVIFAVFCLDQLLRDLARVCDNLLLVLSTFLLLFLLLWSLRSVLCPEFEV